MIGLSNLGLWYHSSHLREQPCHMSSKTCEIAIITTDVLKLHCAWLTDINIIIFSGKVYKRLKYIRTD